MKKINLIIIVALTLSIVYIGVYLIQNALLRQSYESNYTSLTASYIVSSVLQRCDMNIFHPKFLRITHYKDIDEKDISFYKISNLFSQTEKQWQASYTGGSSVRNATFDELLTLVKQDCSQFQDDFENPDPEGINWGYRAAPTEEEIAYEKIRFINHKKRIINNLSPTKLEELKERFDYNPQFSDDELYQWAKEADLSSFEPIK